MNITTDDFITQKALSAASYTASWGTVTAGAFTVSEWVMLAGLACALSTYVINWIYQARKDRRDAERHQLQKALLQKQLHEFDED